MNEITKTPTAHRAIPSPSPVSPFGWLRGEIDRLFDDFGPPRDIFDRAQREAGPAVAIEMTQTNKEYCLTAEVPGLHDADLEVTVADGLLTIAGNKREEREHKENGFLVSERRYGGFRRQIRIPTDVDVEKISAKVRRGVLAITLPKDIEASKSHRKIEIGKD